MNQRMIKRIAIVVIFVGLSFGGWLGTRNPATVSVMGGDWAVVQSNWHDADGAFRGQVQFAREVIKLSPLTIMTCWAGYALRAFNRLRFWARLTLRQPTSTVWISIFNRLTARRNLPARRPSRFKTGRV